MRPQETSCVAQAIACEGLRPFLWGIAATQRLAIGELRRRELERVEACEQALHGGLAELEQAAGGEQGGRDDDGTGEAVDDRPEPRGVALDRDDRRAVA